MSDIPIVTRFVQAARAFAPTGEGYPPEIQQIDAALSAAHDNNQEATDTYIDTLKSCEGWNSPELKEARALSNETYKAYQFVSRMWDSRYAAWAAGNLTSQRLEQMREDIGDQMDVDMMRTP